jgi:two-component system chemotaxis response regulator CheB
MILRKVGSNVRTKIIDTEPENGCKPSADVLFRSAPQVYGGKLITIILTGMGSDGSKVLPILKRSGSQIIAQDEASSVVWGMPGSAVATGVVDHILPLMEIPDIIKRLGKV